MRTAADDLKRELKGISGLKVINDDTHRSHSHGYYTFLATCLKSPNVELWLDEAAGRDIPRFWIGFGTTSEKKFDQFLKRLPNKIVPKRVYTESDWKLEKNGNGVLKSSNEKNLTRPFLERYRTWGGFYFGIYDWGGHAARHTMNLDTWRAVAFIRGVVDSATTDFGNGLVDAAHRLKVEQAAITRVSEHFEKVGYKVKSCEADNCGWDLDARKNGSALRLEVKGLTGKVAMVEVTPNEYSVLVKASESYRLCIVSDALNPDGGALRIFKYDNGWRDDAGETLNIVERTAARISVLSH